jgi:hypothetical protein
MKKYSGLIGLGAAFAIFGGALAGGQFTGQLPAPVIPFTGNETLPLDTNFAAGAQPQTEYASLAQLGSYFGGVVQVSRNALVGGDFGTNPWIRGTTSGDIANTLTYQADGWWNLGGASSAINVSKQTGATDVFSNGGGVTLATLRFQRKAANADTAAICMGQSVEFNDSTRFAGQTAVLSFTVKVGANFSATNNVMTSTIGYGTSASEDTSTNFASKSWTGQVNSDQANTLSTTFTRYTQAVAIPTTATQIGVKFCFTPVGTAGANDWFEIGQIQLEPSSAAASVASASAYEVQPQWLVTARAQRRAWALIEPASNVCQGAGYSSSTTAGRIVIANPMTMRAAPAVTSFGATLSGSTWQVQDAATPIVLSTPFLATYTANTVNNITLTATTGASQTAGRGILLCGAGGGGKLLVSADL